MYRTLNILSASLSLLAFIQFAAGQTLIVDIPNLGGTYGPGFLRPDGSEFVYRVDSSTTGIATLHAASLSAPGTTRTINTVGMDVSSFSSNSFEGRSIAKTSPSQAIYSFALDGLGDPIPLSVEGGTDFVASYGNGVVALHIEGDELSSNPALRDRLYTRTFDGSPPVAITAGVPQSRSISGVSFSTDGSKMVVGLTNPFVSNPPAATSELYLATPGVPGMTRIMESMPTGTRYSPMGSDAASEYFLLFTFNHNISFDRGDLWSVPLDNPPAAVRLSVQPNGEDVTLEGEYLDAAASKAYFIGLETPQGQALSYRVWSASLDGSSPATPLADFDNDHEPGRVVTVPGSPWIYIPGAQPLSGTAPAPYSYSLNTETLELVEYNDPTDSGIRDFALSGDGTTVVFYDARRAGNDLYVGRADDPGTTQSLVFDAPDTDRIVNVEITPNKDFAIVALAPAAQSNDLAANRLLAVPLGGGVPITLEDMTVGPVTGLIGNAADPPRIVDDQLFYLKAYNDGRGGFYVFGLPTIDTLLGDFDSDGDVDGRDFLAWQRDPAIGNLSEWQQNYGAGNLSAVSVPEVGTVLMAVVSVAGMRLGRRERLGSVR